MANEYEYIRLTDREHYNDIVRCQGRKWEHYVDGEWKQTGILIEYFCDESPYYECYEEITEEEAIRMMKK